MLKAEFHLDYGQVGLITLAFMLTASLLQPSIGIYTDRKPQPYSLAIGMGGTLIGLVLLSVAHNYTSVLLAAAFIGTGSALRGGARAQCRPSRLPRHGRRGSIRRGRDYRSASLAVGEPLTDLPGYRCDDRRSVVPRSAAQRARTGIACSSITC